jgi:hypothetical protein
VDRNRGFSDRAAGCIDDGSFNGAGISQGLGES